MVKLIKAIVDLKLTLVLVQIQMLDTNSGISVLRLKILNYLEQFLTPILLATHPPTKFWRITQPRFATRKKIGIRLFLGY